MRIQRRGRIGFMAPACVTARSRYGVQRRRLMVVVTGGILAALLFCAGVASGGGLMAPSVNSRQPWKVSADELKYDQAADQYVGTGNVSITQGDKRLTADFVRFDQKTMQAFARGHVILNVGPDLISGDSIEIDLNTELGTIYNGTIFFRENHFFIRGHKIQKVGPESFTADRISITTCDGERPDWKLTGRNVKLEREGYGKVSHAALWVKNVPVLYAPYLVFPTKRKRQSGLLAPEFNFSDRNGFQYIQPLYWAINESSDATLYWHHLARRGEKIGAQYRYMRDGWSKGAVMFDYLDDRQIDDGQGTSSQDWGYTHDDVLRTNSDRYWLRAKADQRLPHDFVAKLDVDVVSDQDYLREFRDQVTGFYDSRDYFFNTFGRDIDDYDDPVRTSQFDLRRNWDKFTLEGTARWNDDSTLRNSDKPDKTLQTLPFLGFNGSKQKILESPFYYDFTSEYRYYYRQDGESAHRADAHPRVFLPIRYKGYFTLEPSLGLRGTVWHVDQFDDADGAQQVDRERDPTRGLYDVGVDLKTELLNVFDINGKSVDRIKHQIRPRVTYAFIPDVDQADQPNFDPLDRIAKENIITYSLTNTLTSKIRHAAGGGKTSAGNDWNYEYRRFLRFFLEQSYDINKEKDDDPQPFSPIFGELEFSPFRYLSLKANADWNTYDNDFERNGIAARASDYRGDRVYVEHRRKKDDYESIYTSLLVNINNRLWANGEYERDLRADEDVKYGVGLLYNAQCWSVRVSYTDEQDEDRLTFMINLHGIGEFGQSFGVGLGGLGRESSIE